MSLHMFHTVKGWSKNKSKLNKVLNILQNQTGNSKLRHVNHAKKIKKILNMEKPQKGSVLEIL